MNNATLVIANTKTKKLSLLHIKCPGRMDFLQVLNEGVREEGGDPMDYNLVGIVDDIYTWEDKQ